MRVAFKEWAVVVDALARGEQAIMLRRGGISEEPGGFTIEHDRFLLFPTLFHQQRDFVQPAAQECYDRIALELSPSQVTIEFVAEVVDWKRIASLDAALGLHGQHVWREEVIRERFERKGEGSLYAMAVRIHRLPLPVNIPMEPHYGGCRSWIEIDADICTDEAQPVLTDGEFSEKLDHFERALANQETHTTNALRS